MPEEDLMKQEGAVLKAREYNQEYYAEHKLAGLDYLGHGYWHQSYARMIYAIMRQDSYRLPTIFDGGCACGSILHGFKSLQVYYYVMGMDLSEYMVNLGRAYFGFSPSEIICGDMAHVPVEDGTFSLVHSNQVLEHVPDEAVGAILQEFDRITRPGGRLFLCLDALHEGETVEQHQNDPTHVNIKPPDYWTKKFQEMGWIFDLDAYNRFVRSEHGPTAGDDRSFFAVYPDWATWTLIKPE